MSPVTLPSITPSPDDLLIWPCGVWCHRHELEDFADKSDDFAVISAFVPAYDDFFSSLDRSPPKKSVCPSPAPQSPGDSSAAPAEAVQGVCSPTLEQFQRWLETEAHAANHELSMGYINETQEQENERVRLQELRLRACRVATALLLDFKAQA